MTTVREVKQVVKCGKCKQHSNEVTNLPADKREPCPHCGSQSRFFEVEIARKLHIYTELRAKGKRGGRGKPFIELKIGDSLTVATGVWNKLKRVVDHASDWYEERVTDRKTGEVIHQCTERLSKHREHGSAKKKT